MNLKRNWNCPDKKTGIAEKAVHYGKELCSVLVGIWTVLMTAVFPLSMKNHFFQLGEHKFQFFLRVSLYCLIPAAAVLLTSLAAEKNRMGKGKFSILDYGMLFYALFSFASWRFSINRQIAWTGTDGWYGGLRTQLLLVLIYFLVSRSFLWSKLIFLGHFLCSGIVFLLGIGHRFDIDPLRMYEGIDPSYQLQFLSTIGQATWYSSYVCTVLVIGVTLFFLTKRPMFRLGLGVYCVLGFATVVTQNSDSAFVAMAFLCFGLLLAACNSLDRIERFFEVLILMFGTFKLVGIFQLFFPERAMRLDGLSEFLSQSLGSWIILLLFCALYMGIQIYRSKNPTKNEIVKGRLLRKTVWGLLIIGLGMYVLFLWLNTSGLLERILGIRPDHTYLLFDYHWGNSRGFIWKFVLYAFRDFSIGEKIWGIGPDCFSAYCYAKEDLAGILNRFFGHGQTLTNAHNEFLNTLFCMGIAGLISYLTVFTVAFRRFFAEQKSSPLALIGALVVLVYASHNFFCYQQVCCTPFLFLILGMAENAVRNNQKTAGNYLL